VRCRLLPAEYTLPLPIREGLVLMRRNAYIPLADRQRQVRLPWPIIAL
jgi:hypothetical protein